MKKIVFAIFLLEIFCCSCGNDDDVQPVDQLNYISLEIEKDSIFAGDEVQVIATATGSSLQYFWSATKGDILGSGKEVTYASSPCHIGTNTITCKVTNGNDQEETKTVDIEVQE